MRRFVGDVPDDDVVALAMFALDSARQLEPFGAFHDGMLRSPTTVAKQKPRSISFQLCAATSNLQPQYRPAGRMLLGLDAGDPMF